MGKFTSNSPFHLEYSFLGTNLKCRVRDVYKMYSQARGSGLQLLFPCFLETSKGLLTLPVPFVENQQVYLGKLSPNLLDMSPPES